MTRYRSLVICIASSATVIGLMAAAPPEPPFDISVNGLYLRVAQNHDPTTVTAATGQPGQEYYLFCDFTPNGTGGPSSVQFRFLVNEQVVSDVQAPVESGKPVQMGAYWTPPAAGSFTLVCEANPNRTFTETTYANNKRTRQFSVTNLQVDPSAAIKAKAALEAGLILSPSDKGEKKPEPPGGVAIQARITKAEVDRDRAVAGELVKIFTELEITRWADVDSLSRDTDLVEHREGAPIGYRKGVRFVLYRDGKPIAGQKFLGPYDQGKVLTHTFEAKVPQNSGRVCFELVAFRSFRPEARLDSRQACLTIQEMIGSREGRHRRGQSSP